MLLVVIRKSAYFGSKALLKSELITELSAVLAYSAIQNNDKVGMILFTDKIEKFIPPAKNRDQTLRIIRELLGTEAVGQGTDIKNALDFMNKVISRRCICFLISDFQDKDFFKPMRVAAHRHDLIAVYVSDQAEKTLPHLGMIKAIDPESGQEEWVDTDDPAYRQAYTATFNSHERQLEQELNKQSVSLMKLSTDQSYLKPLISFFKERK